MHPGLILGIDGGGSHTVALLAERSDNGRLLARSTSGPSNIQAVGVASAVNALDDAVSELFAAANLPRGPVAAAALGLAGVDTDDAAAVIRQWCTRAHLASHVDVSNDAILLLAAGTPAGWGLAVVAGTGSIAFGRTSQGEFARSGGWGYLLGDEGSAYRLALSGLHAVARAADGCAPPTIMTERLLKFMGLAAPSAMIHAVYLGGWDRARLATMAPVVLQAADDGDSAAQQIIAAEAEELAKTAAAAARKLALPTARLPLALTGGTILNSASYRARFLSALAILGIRPEPVTLVADPAEGALRLARRLLTA